MARRHNPLIEEWMLQSEAALLAYKISLINTYDDPELKLKLYYDINSDGCMLNIIYKEKVQIKKIKIDDLKLSIDDFSEYILMPLLIELQDKFYEYDDCGMLK